MATPTSTAAPTPGTAISLDETTRLFPSTSSYQHNQHQSQNGNSSHAGDRQRQPQIQAQAQPEDLNLMPNQHNAVALHNPLNHLNGSAAAAGSGSLTLDPSILNLSLGALLTNPAGLQLLASLGQGAVSYQQQQQQHQQGQEGGQGGGRFEDEGVQNGGYRSQNQRNGNMQDHPMDNVVVGSGSTSGSIGNGITQPYSSAYAHGHDQDPSFAGLWKDPSPSESLLANLDPNLDTNSAQGLPNLTANVNVNDPMLDTPTDIDWSDPTIRALIESFDQDPEGLIRGFESGAGVGAGVGAGGPSDQQMAYAQDQTNGVDNVNMYTNDGDTFSDMFDIHGGEGVGAGSDGVGTGPSTSAAGSVMGDETGMDMGGGSGGEQGKPVAQEEDIFAGPTRKKRKTDQRE